MYEYRLLTSNPFEWNQFVAADRTSLTNLRCLGYDHDRARLRLLADMVFFVLLGHLTQTILLIIPFVMRKVLETFVAKQ